MVDLSGAMASQDARPLGPAPHETEPDVDNPTILYSYPPTRSAQKCERGSNSKHPILVKGQTLYAQTPVLALVQASLPKSQ